MSEIAKIVIKVPGPQGAAGPNSISTSTSTNLTGILAGNGSTINTTTNGSTLTSLNASNVSSGTLPDARLSSNIPKLNVNNVFTNSGTTTFEQSITCGAINVGSNGIQGADGIYIDCNGGSDTQLRASGGGRVLFTGKTVAEGNFYAAEYRINTPVSQGTYPEVEEAGWWLLKDSEGNNLGLVQLWQPEGGFGE